MSFWDFPSYTKIDVLHEPEHNSLIEAALDDPQTQIFPAMSTLCWTFAGAEDALRVELESYSSALTVWLINFWLFAVQPTRS